VKTLNEKIDLKKIEQKIYSEFMIDGITEILAGLVLIFVPVIFFNVTFISFLILFIVFGKPVVENIRERTTYPRIGRVEFKSEEDQEDYSVKKSLLSFLLLLVGTGVITVTVMFIVEGEILNTSLWYKWVSFWFGQIMFGPSLFLVEKTGQKHYYLLGFLSTILGLLFSVLIFPDVMVGISLYFFSLGILALFFGITKHIWFIRNYPVIHFEEE
jgi:hypothetical protein